MGSPGCDLLRRRPAGQTPLHSSKGSRRQASVRTQWPASRGADPGQEAQQQQQQQQEGRAEHAAPAGGRSAQGWQQGKLCGHPGWAGSGGGGPSKKGDIRAGSQGLVGLKVPATGGNEKVRASWELGMEGEQLAACLHPASPQHCLSIPGVGGAHRAGPPWLDPLQGSLPDTPLPPVVTDTHTRLPGGKTRGFILKRLQS